MHSMSADNNLKLYSDDAQYLGYIHVHYVCIYNIFIYCFPHALWSTGAIRYQTLLYWIERMYRLNAIFTAILWTALCNFIISQTNA